MMTYKIEVSDIATYIIRANDIQKAKELAVEWFSERNPYVTANPTEEEPEYTIQDDNANEK